jgi:hypothetical protein
MLNWNLNDRILYVCQTCFTFYNYLETVCIFKVCYHTTTLPQCCKVHTTFGWFSVFSFGCFPGVWLILANINQTPGKHPKENTMNTEHGKSSKSRIWLVVSFPLYTTRFNPRADHVKFITEKSKSGANICQRTFLKFSPDIYYSTLTRGQHHQNICGPSMKLLNLTSIPQLWIIVILMPVHFSCCFYWS